MERDRGSIWTTQDGRQAGGAWLISPASAASQSESVWPRCEAAAVSNLVSVTGLSSLPPLRLTVPGISAVSPGLLIWCGKCMRCALISWRLGEDSPA